MKNLTKIFVTFLIVSFISVNAGGKYGTIGKIYTEERALELYGPVIESFDMDADELTSLLEHCENYMMFTIKNNEVVVTDDNRNVLTNNRILLSTSILDIVTKNDAISEDEQLHLMSKSVVLELVEKGGSDVVKFGKRQNVITIMCGLLAGDLVWMVK